MKYTVCMRLSRVLGFFSFLFVLRAFPLFCEEASESQTQDGVEFTDEEKARFRGIAFVRDLLDDKYPFRVDFGAEPHRHGSMVFGAAYYDWTESIGSSFRGEYDHYTTSNNAVSSLENSEVRTISLIPMPFVLYFGDENIYASSLFTQLGIGFYFQSARTTTSSGQFFAESEAGTGFATVEGSTDAYLLGPAFSVAFDIPLHKYISIFSEAFFVPAFFLTVDSSSVINFYLTDQTIPYDYSVSTHMISTPFLRQTVCIDLVKYLRLKVQMSYMHTTMRSLSLDEDESSKYDLHSITLRYGGELLRPTKNRKKFSHLRAGLYYEMNWDKYIFKDSATTNYTGKWVLCFRT